MTWRWFSFTLSEDMRCNSLLVECYSTRRFSRWHAFAVSQGYTYSSSSLFLSAQCHCNRDEPLVLKNIAWGIAPITSLRARQPLNHLFHLTILSSALSLPFSSIALSPAVALDRFLPPLSSRFPFLRSLSLRLSTPRHLHLSLHISLPSL